MTAPIKAVLIAIIAGAVLLVTTHLAFFFPFYMTMVVEAFNLANVAANDNYIKESYYEDSYDSLIARPMFAKANARNPGVSGNEERTGNVTITVTNLTSGDVVKDAVGRNDEFDLLYDTDGELCTDGSYKPYCQRGEPITITITACYPVEFSMWDWRIEQDIPVSFSMTAIGLKYYKDLDYDFLFS